MFVILNYAGDIVGEVPRGERLFDYLDYDEDEILFNCRPIAVYDNENRVIEVFNMICSAFNHGEKQFTLPTK